MIEVPMATFVDRSAVSSTSVPVVDAYVHGSADADLRLAPPDRTAAGRCGLVLGGAGIGAAGGAAVGVCVLYIVALTGILESNLQLFAASYVAVGVGALITALGILFGGARAYGRVRLSPSKRPSARGIGCGPTGTRAYTALLLASTLLVAVPTPASRYLRMVW